MKSPFRSTPHDGLGIVPNFPPDLRQLIDDTLRASIAVDKAEAEHHLRMAVLARKAAGRRVDGHSALAECARVLHISRSTLQAYAKLGARWELEEIRYLLERRNGRGRPLSVSHLLALAKLPCASRSVWVARALSEDLDVQALRRAIVGQGEDAPHD